MTAAESGQRVVDADGHLVEMPDLYAEHTEAKHRDVALRFGVDDLGWDCLTFRGEPVMECLMTVPGDRSLVDPHLRHSVEHSQVAERLLSMAPER